MEASFEEKTPRLFDNRYALKGEPRDGGMSKVYAAFDVQGEHDKVAVKMLRSSERAGDKWAMKAFEREQRLLGSLDHRNIVKLLDGGRDPDSGTRYLVFPWLERTLTRRLAAGALSWQHWWVELGEPILDALAYAFGADVIHRDLKPGNVLLGDDGNPQLIDFGIAKLISHIAPDLTLAGHASPPFAPPTLDGPRHIATRDVYAWAALTVFAVSGVDPYDPSGANDRYAWLRAAREKSELPSLIAEIIDRCLSEDAANRPANASVLSTLLRQAEQRRKAERLAVGELPVVHLSLTRNARENVQLDHELTADEVEALLSESLAEGVVVLPYGGENDRDYRIIGTELLLHVRADDSVRSQLVVLNALTLPDSRLERDRANGLPAGVAFSFRTPSDPETACDVVAQLERDVAAHEIERTRARQRARRARRLVVWRAILNILRTAEAQREDPIPYKDVRRSGGSVVFTLVEPARPGLVGERRSAPADGRGFTGEIVRARGREVTIRPSQDHVPSISIRGELRVDTKPSLSAIKRQVDALDALEYGRALRGDLKSLLIAPATAKPPAAVTVAEWSQPVDEAKQNAVRMALGSEDILVVQGPPGTGKTTFICELVIQQLRRQPDARILISSQTNAAVDNALERIAQQDPSIRQLRIGRPDDARISAGVRDLVVDQHMDDWRRQATQSGRAWLRAWAKENGVSERQVETAMRLRELAEALDLQQHLEREITRREERLADLRAVARRALPTSTAPEILRELNSELDELRDELQNAQSNATDAAARLTELGEMTRRERPHDREAVELRQRADEILPTRDETSERCQRLIEVLAEWHARFGRGPGFNAAALVRSQVVGATCVGLGAVRGLEDVEFDLCIIDEASKATAPELVIPMTRGRRFVIVGDDRQLPPYIEDALLDPATLEERGLTADEVRAPLFSQLAQDLPPECVVPLTHQHRMHPAIGRLISTCFYGSKLTSEPREPSSLLSIVAPRPVTWMTTAKHDDRFERKLGDTSTTNELEVRCIKTFLNTANGLASAARRTLDVAVLTGYSAQRTLIEQRLMDQIEWTSLRIECQTVDAFQGREADVVLYSVTRSNKRGALGFLRERPRINVALSRARDCLVIVGDHVCARRGSLGPLREVVEYIEDHPADCALMEARR
jgi:hypothetical protein